MFAAPSALIVAGCAGPAIRLPRSHADVAAARADSGGHRKHS